MKSTLFLLLLSASSLAALHESAQHLFTPDQIQYGPVPAFLPPGAVHGMSPLEINYINPNDDPRKKK